MQKRQEARDALHPNRTILIVEDDTAFGPLLQEALQEEAMYQVFLTTSAEMALQMLQTINPELFLLDYHLPKMNGLELADHLQSTVEWEYIPILLMTASFPPELGARKQIRQLQKPFNLETLLQWVVELLKNDF
jgi:CheY-like chemotaxis protein